MGKFNKKTVTPKAKTPKGPITVATTSTTRTALGAPGFTRDSKSELFLLGVANMVGQNTFHEAAANRDDRFKGLVHTVAMADPEWMLSFVTWLRRKANMRSASMVAGVEAAAALHGAGNTDGWARKLVSAGLNRADEPGEALGYWLTTYGRTLPKPVKRGLGDAAQRLYTMRTMLKYDSPSHAVRFGDVLDLTHPDPATPEQGALFREAINRRHGRGGGEVTAQLKTLSAQGALRKAAQQDMRVLLNTQALKDAGMTWEDVFAIAGDKLPKNELWEALIPTMGYMALLRNLNNFDKTGVSDKVAQWVCLKLCDEKNVAESKQFPFRFLAAYRNVGNLRWAYALEQGLGHSLRNVPSLPGRTLILVDQSPSMFPGFHYSTANTSDISLADQAKTFGVALALRAEKADLVQYGSTSEVIKFRAGESMLKVMERFRSIDGTLTPAAAQTHFKGHDRIVIITDEQTATWRNPQPRSNSWGYWQEWVKAPADWATLVGIPESTPVYTWNLGGYKAGHLAGGANRHWLGGLTDQAFSLIPLMEAAKDGTWPWLIETAA